MDEQTAKILNAISTMVQTEGWQFLKRDFQFVIDTLQAQINEPGGNEMKYSDGDLLKIKMNLLKEILEYPAKFAQMAIAPKDPEDQDPYNNK